MLLFIEITVICSGKQTEHVYTQCEQDEETLMIKLMVSIVTNSLQRLKVVIKALYQTEFMLMLHIPTTKTSYFKWYINLFCIESLCYLQQVRMPLNQY
jgi:hypothetical protein